MGSVAVCMSLYVEFMSLAVLCQCTSVTACASVYVCFCMCVNARLLQHVCSVCLLQHVCHCTSTTACVSLYLHAGVFLASLTRDIAFYPCVVFSIYACACECVYCHMCVSACVGVVTGSICIKKYSKVKPSERKCCFVVAIEKPEEKFAFFSKINTGMFGSDYWRGKCSNASMFRSLFQLEMLCSLCVIIPE